MKGKAGGRVMVGFTVAETGKIKDVRVLQSDEASLNQEAERIVSEMPDWIPEATRQTCTSEIYCPYKIWEYQICRE